MHSRNHERRAPVGAPYARSSRPRTATQPPARRLSIALTTIGIVGLAAYLLCQNGCSKAESASKERLHRPTTSLGVQTQPAPRAMSRPARPTTAAPRAEASGPRPLVPASLLTTGPLKGRLQGVYLGKARHHKNLRLIPVIAPKAPVAGRILTVDAAFKADLLSVTEAGQATVPRIRVKKRPGDPIFIMTGEMFVGAHQDRISKHDVLLGRRGGTFQLPVYCVEQGRWHGGKTFRSANAVSSQQLRMSAAKKGSQGEVWGKVAAKNRNVRAQTSTQTMNATFRSRRFRKLSPSYLRALADFAKQHPRSIGALVLINGTVTSLDLFANHGLFAALWPKLLKAFVLDAVDPKFKGSEFPAKNVSAFLGALHGVKHTPSATPGKGREYLLASPEVAGTVLIAHDRIIHLALFPEKVGRKLRFDSPRNGRARPGLGGPTNSSSGTTFPGANLAPNSSGDDQVPNDNGIDDNQIKRSWPRKQPQRTWKKKRPRK